MARSTSVLLLCTLLDIIHGCEVKQFNNGSEKEEFHFQTNVKDPKDLKSYYVQHIAAVNSTLVKATFNNGTLTKGPSMRDDVKLVGNVSNGDFSFILYHMSAAKTGIYELTGSGDQNCIALYILGIPDTPTLSSGAAPESGGSLNFTCSSNSNTFPAGHGLMLIYTWKIANETNPVSDRFLYNGGNLSILNVQRGDKDKSVTCMAKENVIKGFPSNASKEGKIKVLYGPIQIKLTPGNESYRLQAGTMLLNITCEADCYEECSYTWYKNNSSFQATASLVLSEIHAADAATYQCEASRGAHSLQKNVSIFVIYGPENITLSPAEPSYTVNRGGYLKSIICSAHCFPPCSYMWQRYGQEEFVSTNETLPLGDNIQKDFFGTYHCVSTNSERIGKQTAMTNVSIYIRYGPDSLTFSPETKSSLVMVEGQFLESISCLTDCYPGCVETWKKGTELSSKAKGGVLLIGNVTRYDAGNYHCLAMNNATEYNKTQMKNLTLEVHYPPDANISQELRQRDIALTCIAKGNPDNYSFEKWVHIAPDKSTEVQKYRGKSSSNKNILELKNVTYMDSGFYSCKVSNNIQTASAEFGTAEIEVKIKEKPLVLLDQREFDAKLSSNISVFVRFYTNDFLNVTWVKKNSTNASIQIDMVKYDTSLSRENVTMPFYTKSVSLLCYRSQLHVRDVSVDDFDEYDVLIRNTEGVAQVKLHIKPTGPPEVPVGFEVLPGSQTTTNIKFSWYPGFHGGADQTFHIEYTSTGQKWVEGAAVPGGLVLFEQFQATVGRLLPGSSYFFRIYASNMHGNSSHNNITLLGNTTFIDKEIQEPNGLVSTAVGSGLGAAAVIVAVVVVIVLMRRRKIQNKAKGSTTKSGENNDRLQLHIENDSEINLNPMYESAGPKPSRSGDIYTQVEKHGKQAEHTAPDENKNLYAEVKRSKKILDKPTKSKKDKTDRRQDVRKRKKGNDQREMIYENAESADRMPTGHENVYENPSCSTSDEQSKTESPSRLRNEEGLIYIKLDLPIQKEKTSVEPYIHGEEDRTEYADIAFGKVGEQLVEVNQEDEGVNEDVAKE